MTDKKSQGDFYRKVERRSVFQSDAINYVCDYLRPIGKIAVSKVLAVTKRKMMYEHRSGFMFRKYLQALSIWPLLELLISRGIMSGSFILRYLIDATWESGDIDIYMTGDDYIKLNRPLSTNNYHYTNLSAIQNVYTYEQDGFTIQIIIVDDPVSFIKSNFDLSFCRNYYDGTCIHILHPHSILTHSTTLNLASYIDFGYITKEVTSLTYSLDTFHMVSNEYVRGRYSSRIS
jgi:hypothetical protein